MSSPRTIRLSFLRFSDGLRTQLEDKADALGEANRDLGKDRSSMKKEKKKRNTLEKRQSGSSILDLRPRLLTECEVNDLILLKNEIDAG